MNGSSFESLLVCPVCLDAYVDPKVLPCLHTFCIKCITNCCKPLRHEVSCPVCKSLSRLGPLGINGLPNDFKVQQLRDAIQSQKESKVVSMLCDDDDQVMPEIDALSSTPESPATTPSSPSSPSSSAMDQAPKLCDVCTIDDKLANMHCIQCSINLCEECHNGKHKTNRMFQMHQTIPIFPGKMQIQSNCEKHPGQNLRYYCVICKLSQCTICVMSHDTNHNIESLDKKSIDTCMKSLHNLHKKIDARGTALRRCYDTMKSSLRRKHTEITVAQSEIKKRASSLIDMIKSQETVFYNELQLKKNSQNFEQLQSINEQLKKSLQMKTSISSIINDETRSPIDCLQLLHDYKGQMTKLDKEVQSTSKDNEIFVYMHKDNLAEVSTQIRVWFGYVKTTKKAASLDQRGKRLSEELNCGPSPLKVKYNNEGLQGSRWTPTNTYNCDMLLEDDSDA